MEFGLDLVAPPWLLGCVRSGGAAAADAFGHRMRAHDALRPGRGRVRALPMVVPVFGRAEAERIEAERAAAEEAAPAEAERIAAEQAEAERLEAERIAAEQPKPAASRTSA